MCVVSSRATLLDSWG